MNTKKNNNQRSRTPQQSFVQYFRSKPNISQENRNDNTNPYSSDNDRNKHNQIIIMIDTEIMIDIVAIAENIRKTTTDLILDKDITIDLEAHIDLDLIIFIKEELHLDVHIDLHIEITQITSITVAQDTDLVLNHKETPLNDILIHIDLHQDLETLDHNLEHPHETDNKTE